mgnify:CR=1 FL=1
MNKNDIAKVTISYDADNALNRMLGEVNKDFTGGRITKHQLLSWFVTSQDGAPFQRAIEKVQREYFDHVAHMENLIKRIKKARKQGIPDEEAERLLKNLNDSPARQRNQTNKESNE